MPVIYVRHLSKKQGKQRAASAKSNHDVTLEEFKEATQVTVEEQSMSSDNGNGNLKVMSESKTTLIS